MHLELPFAGGQAVLCFTTAINSVIKNQIFSIVLKDIPHYRVFFSPLDLKCLELVRNFQLLGIKLVFCLLRVSRLTKIVSTGRFDLQYQAEKINDLHLFQNLKVYQLVYCLPTFTLYIVLSNSFCFQICNRQQVV